MNTNLIQDIAHQIVQEQILTNWRYYLMLLSLALVSGAIGAFVSSYFKTRGANLATKADFENLLSQIRETTTVTEQIKTQVSHSSWKEQKQWDLKREVYLGLLKALTQWREVIVEARISLFDEKHELKKGPSGEIREDLKKKRIEATDELARWQAIAGIVVSKDFLEKIRSLRSTILRSLGEKASYEDFVKGPKAILELEREVADQAKLDLLK